MPQPHVLAVLFGLYALYMLVRYAPVLLRRRPAGRPPAPGARAVAALNVVMALVILLVAVTTLVRALI